MLAIVGVLIQREDYLLQGATALTLAAAATGLGLALGLAGEFVLAVTAIFAVGAYVPAILTTNHGWGYWPAVPTGAIVAIFAGLVVSIVGLRMSRFYFGMIGFFIVFLIPNITQIAVKETGGSAGLAVPTVPSLFGQTLGVRGMYALAAVVLLACLLLSRNIYRSPIGVSLRRMRDNPTALSTDGQPIWKLRLFVYIVSSVMAGLGGAVYGHLSGYMLPTYFSLGLTVLLLAAVIVGGPTKLLGPTLGVAVLYIVPRVVIDVEGYSESIYGLIIIVAVILFPRGLAGGFPDFLSTSLRRRSGVGRSDYESVDISSSGQSPDAELAADLVGELLSLPRSRKPDQFEAVGVRKRYRGVQAIALEESEKVTVESGSVHLLLGPNGSGKTTLLNVMYGLVTPERGNLSLDGLPERRPSAWRLARRGLGRSFQSPVLPDEITPVDLIAGRLKQHAGVTLFGWTIGSPASRRARRQSVLTAGRVLDAAGLATAADRRCSELTSAQRRILDVVYTFCGPGRLFLLDEPAAGLSEIERRRLSETIRALKAEGLGFLVVEHDLALAMELADTVTVLTGGEMLAQGTPDSIRANADVRTVLIGES